MIGYHFKTFLWAKFLEAWFKSRRRMKLARMSIALRILTWVYSCSCRSHRAFVFGFTPAPRFLSDTWTDQSRDVTRKKFGALSFSIGRFLLRGFVSEKFRRKPTLHYTCTCAIQSFRCSRSLPLDPETQSGWPASESDSVLTWLRRFLFLMGVMYGEKGCLPFLVSHWCSSISGRGMRSSGLGSMSWCSRLRQSKT